LKRGKEIKKTAGERHYHPHQSAHLPFREVGEKKEIEKQQQREEEERKGKRKGGRKKVKGVAFWRENGLS